MSETNPLEIFKINPRNDIPFLPEQLLTDALERLRFEDITVLAFGDRARYSVVKIEGTAYIATDAQMDNIFKAFTPDVLEKLVQKLTNENNTVVPQQKETLYPEDTKLILEGDQVIITPDHRVTIPAREFAEALATKIKQVRLNTGVSMSSQTEGYTEYAELQVAGYVLIVNPNELSRVRIGLSQRFTDLTELA